MRYPTATDFPEMLALRSSGNTRFRLASGNKLESKMG
jgi:hypothetical protein